MSGRNQDDQGLSGADSAGADNAGNADASAASATPAASAASPSPAAAGSVGGAGGMSVEDALRIGVARCLAERFQNEAHHTPGEAKEYSATGSDPVRQLWGPVSLGPVVGRGLGRNLAQLPHTDTQGRLLWHPIVLSAVTIPYDVTARLRGFRQYLSIGALAAAQYLPIGTIAAAGRQIPPAIYPLELPVTSPAWTFPDGGVRWHLSHMPGSPSPSGVAARPATEDPRGALPILGLGTFYDIRGPWVEMDPTFDAVFKGYDTLIFWAEVLQTDPATRAPLELPEGPPDFLPPEDRFVLGTANMAQPAIFWRIAGSLIVQFDTR